MLQGEFRDLVGLIEPSIDLDSTLLGRSTAQTLQRPQLTRLVAPTVSVPLRSASTTREIKINGPGKVEVAFADGAKVGKFEEVYVLVNRLSSSS